MSDYRKEVYHLGLFVKSGKAGSWNLSQACELHGCEPWAVSDLLVSVFSAENGYHNGITDSVVRINRLDPHKQGAFQVAE